MSWLARNKGCYNEDGNLNVFKDEPIIDNYGVWSLSYYSSGDESYDDYGVSLPDDADEKLINKHISWKDKPVEIE